MEDGVTPHEPDTRYNEDMMLAQSVDFGRILFPVLLGIAAVGGLIAIAMAVRKYLLRGNDDALRDPAAGFSMGHLRQLVREGKMSQEEYEATKARIVAGAHRIADHEAVNHPDLPGRRKTGDAAAEPPDAIEHKPSIDERM
jgi:hypothetical protein